MRFRNEVRPPPRIRQTVDEVATAEAVADWSSRRQSVANEPEFATEPPPPEPEWCRDPEWAADLEHVWRTRMATKIVAWTERARIMRDAARWLAALEDSGRRFDIAAPGVRQADATRRQRRAVSRDDTRYVAGCRVVVRGPHGSISTPGRRVEVLKAAEHAECRARAAAMSRRDVVMACRRRWRTISCGCTTKEVEVGCDQTLLCGWCRKRHWKRWRRRIVRSLEAHYQVAIREWVRRGKRGPRPGIYLLTLTAPHSGDLVTDRRVLGEAWRDLSKRASYGGYEYGKGDAKRWSEKKWWGAHALVYEATDGTKHDGHLHAHVAMISSWVPYREVREQWARSIPGAVVVDFVSPTQALANAKAKGYSADQSGTAANYLAKYVTKGVEPREMTGRKAGELLVAFAGRRKVTTSAGFWKPLSASGPACCAKCSAGYRLTGSPIGLQEHVPASVLRSLSERTRWKPPRGSPQVRLRWPSVRSADSPNRGQS